MILVKFRCGPSREKESGSSASGPDFSAAASRVHRDAGHGGAAVARCERLQALSGLVARFEAAP